jgi:hypothetical protein
VKEREMMGRTQDALERNGIGERGEAAAIFLPRGHFAGAFAGGLVGDELAAAASERPEGPSPG